MLVCIRCAAGTVQAHDQYHHYLLDDTNGPTLSCGLVDISSGVNDPGGYDIGAFEFILMILGNSTARSGFLANCYNYG